MIPLEKKRVIQPAHFPKMPQLYLELLENKDKIKKEFLKTEFVPKYEETTIVFDDEGHEITQQSRPAANTRMPSMTKPIPPFKRTSEEKKTGREEKKPTATASAAAATATAVSIAATAAVATAATASKPLSTTSGKKDVLSDEIVEEKKEPQEPGDPLSSFLKKSRSIGSRDTRQTPDRKAAYEEKKEFLLHDEQPQAPPSLQDLESSGAFETGGIKNVNHVSKREQDQEQKLREYLFKYDLLRRSYPNEEIPKFTIHSDPDYVVKTYEDLRRNLSLGDNVNKYKKWLMFGFMGTEAIIGNVLGFDMKGFTKQQIIEMPTYESTLIELGEKNYVPQSKWPVELRLLGMIIMNAAFFVAGKMAFKATGTDVLGSMNTAANAGVSASNTLHTRKKQTMTGPSISLDDIPLSKENQGEPKGPSTSSSSPAQTPGITFVNK